MGKQNKKIVTKDGKEYIVQNLPVREAMRIRQESRHGQNVDDINWYEQLLEHCIVDPANLTIDSFESVSEIEELMSKVMEFVYGGK